MKKELSVVVSKKLSPPETSGRHYRVLCMTGPDKGISYYLKNKRVVLGRGDTADIKVQDQKSSREHAELVLNKDEYVLTDLGSQNGIIVNDLKVQQHSLKDNDKIIIGKTVFKYNVYDIKKLVVQETPKIEEEVKEVSKPAGNNKFRLILIGLIVVFGAFMFLGDEETPTNSKASKNAPKEITDNFTLIMKDKKNEDDLEVKEKVGTHIHMGQREFREGNYFRAIEEFNMALLLSPKNGNASYYLNKTKQALDNEIETNSLQAKQFEEALKFEDAAVSYCSIVRQLNDYPDDQRYKDAMDNIAKIEEKLGREKGDIKCIEK